MEMCKACQSIDMRAVDGAFYFTPFYDKNGGKFFLCWSNLLAHPWGLCFEAPNGEVFAANVDYCPLCGRELHE